jgi:sporulation protein YlmC with PRC-barrel domain
MEIKKNANIYTPDHKEVGHVKRVVLDPKTKQISHLVIRQGTIMTEDYVMPIRMVAEANEDQVLLTAEAGDLSDLPKFEETYYIHLNTDEPEPVLATPLGAYAPGAYAPSLYSYPPITTIVGGEPINREVKQVEQNIPEGSVALKEGAKVITEDGHNAGKIKQVFMDSGTKQATHILISKGTLVKEQKLIPTFWIRLFGENEVHLAAPANVLEKLQPYEAAPVA